MTWRILQDLIGADFFRTLLAIKVVRRGEEIISIDNRRLAAMKAAGIKNVVAIWATKKELLRAIKKGVFSSVNEGVSVVIRRGKRP
jgi:hypothetical protein